MDLEEKILFIAIGLAAIGLVDVPDPFGSTLAGCVVFFILTQEPKPPEPDDGEDETDDFDMG